MIADANGRGPGRRAACGRRCASTARAGAQRSQLRRLRRAVDAPVSIAAVPLRAEDDELDAFEHLSAELERKL